jgi:hypothetical protein
MPSGDYVAVYTDDSNVTLRAMSITIYKTTMEA